MNRTWPFGRTIAAGFAIVVALTLMMALIALVGLQHVVERKDEVIDTDAQLVLDVQRLLTTRDTRAAANRGYLISGQQKYLDEQYRNDELFAQELSEIRKRADTDRAHQLVDQISRLQHQFVLLDRAPVELRQAGASPQAVTEAWEKIDPQRLSTADAMNTLADYQQALVDSRKQQASDAAKTDKRRIMIVMVIIVLASAAVAGVLTRRLRTRIGTAVGAVQNSSAELQSTANHQVAGAKEQASTVAEISTSSSELLATSQQIAESAQQVTYVAGQTAQAGQAGRSIVITAQESMTEIRTQVDAIVERMVDLGDKSQQIGAVLDIVAEVAEQTNILAINSQIEAAGAGESGRRFAAVADEIRKLADRVMESTKDIRDLIDATRSSVNATVMSIEIGSKAVDTGSAQVEHVASSFDQIVGWMSTTTDAAREIELSTRQQALAVEQVTRAIENVAEATREAENNSDHTLHTASQLQELSTRLRELVQAGA